VTFTNGNARTLVPRLIVGADGRASTVRRQASIELQKQEPPHFIAGLLVSDLDVPDNDFLTTEKGMFFATFVQKDGWARIYVCPSTEDPQRFAGPDGPAKILQWGAELESVPFAKAFGNGSVAGPCATYPGDDTWTAEPYSDGVLLIGDAAGHNNPLVGQGLSLAMRDVRLVSELLLSGAPWSRELFAEYGAERVERMRRVRFTANYAVHLLADGTSRGRARREAFRRALQGGDFSLVPPLLTMYSGPQEADAAIFEQPVMDRIVSLGA